ncbi:MAG: hypothetical protein QW614_00060 [Candidatus Caldarchaeum sp.]|uniref:Phosphoserine phosphatase n=1 Tax=Caldiarchaeum subterraneum TaxID=311458 RepID=A0A7C5L877_CALS0
MTGDSVSAIEEEIFQIRARLAELRRKKAEYEEEAAKHLEKRDKIHERIKEIKEKNASYIDAISSSRNEIAELRSKLDEVVNKIKELRVEKEKLLSQHVADNVKGYTAQEIMKRVRELEERIQTDILRPEEERKLYEEIRSLSGLLDEVQKREGVAEKLRELNNQISVFAEEANKLREAIRLKRKELDSARDAYQSVRDLIQQLKPEADMHHQAYIDAKKKAQMAEAEEILLVSRIVELQEFVKKHRELETKTREYAMRERVKARALEKLSVGEKLSFDEMKVLMEDEEAWDVLVKKSHTVSKR